MWQHRKRHCHQRRRETFLKKKPKKKEPKRRNLRKMIENGVLGEIFVFFLNLIRIDGINSGWRSISLLTEFYPVLLGFTGFYLVLLGFTGFD